MRTAAFVVVQVPFADFRPLHADRLNMLARPEWEHDNPTGFVRGFGKVSPRNASAAGLPGEHSYADFDNALKFPNRIEYASPDRQGFLRPVPWFRRLYFDGRLSGRFEVGFRVFESHPDAFPMEPIAFEINPAKLARSILDTPVQVHSPNGWRDASTAGNCWRLLSDAYVEATTSHNNFSHAFEETRGAFYVGPAFLHMRLSASRVPEGIVDLSRIARGDEGEIYISSSGGNFPRNNILIQTTVASPLNESGTDRLTRVLFAHLNSVIFSHAQFIKNNEALSKAVGRDDLSAAVAVMLDRLGGLTAKPNDIADAQFADGLRLFSQTYAGRIPRLLEQLEALASEWNKPSFFDRAAGYFKGLHDLIVTTAVEKSVEIAVRGGNL